MRKFANLKVCHKKEALRTLAVHCQQPASAWPRRRTTSLFASGRVSRPSRHEGNAPLAYRFTRCGNRRCPGVLLPAMHFRHYLSISGKWLNNKKFILNCFSSMLKLGIENVSNSISYSALHNLDL